MRGLMILLLLVGALEAAPIQWTTASGGNGHWYEYVPADSIFAPVSYATAKAAAEAASWQGQQGYLLTVTSAEENAFVTEAFSLLYGFGGSTGFWLALSDAEVEGEWRWTSGPEAGQLAIFTNWSSGQPSNLMDDLDYAQLTVQAQSPTNRGFWVSTTSQGAFGYVVEYNDAPSSPGDVPEPSSVVLVVGALAAGWWRKAKR
jgi:hypothetical protein